MPFDRRQETLVSLFCGRARLSGSQAALYLPAGTRPSAFSASDPSPPTQSRPASAARFDQLNWNELASDVRRTAAALKRLGVTPGDRGAQVSGNRYMWVVIDLAVHLARGVHVA